MNKVSRRHTNSDFSQFTNLTLADVLMSGLLGMILLGMSSRGDTGLIIKLPPYYYETEDTLKIRSSDILHLDIDSTSQLLINNNLRSFSNAENSIHDFMLKKLLNNKRSYIWIRVSRHSRYVSYITLRDAIKRAETSIANELSIRCYGVSYSDDMPISWRKKIRESMSLCIIEEEELSKPSFELRPFINCYQAVNLN